MCWATDSHTPGWNMRLDGCGRSRPPALGMWEADARQGALSRFISQETQGKAIMRPGPGGFPWECSLSQPGAAGPPQEGPGRPVAALLPLGSPGCEAWLCQAMTTHASLWGIPLGWLLRARDAARAQPHLHPGEGRGAQQRPLDPQPWARTHLRPHGRAGSGWPHVSLLGGGICCPACQPGVPSQL